MVGGESILAALVGAAAGGGGVKALGRLFGPERDAEIAQYYRDVISDLVRENRELRETAEQLQAQVSGLRGRITALELAKDAPPGYLA